MMKTEEKLSWAKTDIENICGFNSKKFTRVNLVFTFILGLLLAAAFYLALLPLRGRGIQMIDMFFHGGEENRSSIPYYTVFLFCFSILLLFRLWIFLQHSKPSLCEYTVGNKLE